jgi:hypothetical protein
MFFFSSVPCHKDQFQPLYYFVFLQYLEMVGGNCSIVDYGQEEEKYLVYR